MSESLAKSIARLLPSSIAWLIERGYVEREDDQGMPCIKVTEAGYRYFASINMYTPDAADRSN